MPDRAHKTLGVLLALAVLGLAAWVPALAYSQVRNRPTLPLAVMAILGLNAALIRLVTARDTQLRALLSAGLIYRLTVTAGFILVLFGFYGGGDALLYHREGVMHAQQFWTFGELPSLHSTTGTSFISHLTGAAYILLGSSFVAGMLAFSTLAFWGSYFFLKLYRETFPDGGLVAVGILVFFLPSTVFWTASIGKDAAIFFFLGLFTYSFASLSPGFRVGRFLLLMIGLVGVARIRPHIALMLALAATTAIILGLGLPRIPRRVSQVFGLAVIVAGITLLVPVVQGYLRLEELSLASTREFLDWQLRVTTKGGSAITASDSLPVRLALTPLTLLRPFPWEVHNLTSALASAEGLLVAFLVLRFWRPIVHNLKSARTNLTLLFALVFTVEFMFAFSSVANFGILARQRVMLIPILLCLLVDARRAVESPAAPAQPTASGPRLRWSPGGQPG